MEGLLEQFLCKAGPPADYERDGCAAQRRVGVIGWVGVRKAFFEVVE